MPARLVIWKLDRMGFSLHRLEKTAASLCERGVGLEELTGTGVRSSTPTAHGRLPFATLVEFESDLI